MKTDFHAFHCVLAIALAGLTPLAKQAIEKPPLASAVPQTAGDAAASPVAWKLILLQPSIVFQQVGGNAPRIPSGNANGVVLVGDQLVPIVSYQNVLLDAARKALGSKVALVDFDKLEPSAVKECNNLERLGPGLAKGSVNDLATKSLASLGAIDGQYAILAQFFVITQQPAPLEGEDLAGTTLASDSALIQVALISAKNGKVIWKGQRLIRNKNKLLRPNDIARSKALQQLYQDFNTK